MSDLLERKLLFVTGKRTLVGEMDAKGNLADFFETAPTQFEEREILPNLWAMSMDTEASLKQYISLQLKLPLVSRVGPLARVFDFVATAAPGVKEIVTVGKFVWEVRERHYDLVVVDASATGHIIGQLSAPQAINELVKVGLIRQQTDWLLEILGDATRTGLVIVATPEEMPVNETIELSHRVEKETNVNLAAIIVNRVLPELFGRGEEEVFERLNESDAVTELDRVMSGSSQPLLDAARLAVTLRRTRADHLEHLRESVPHDLPLLYVPYLFVRSHGLRSTRQIAEALSAELGF